MTTLFKYALKGERIGVVFGTFAPFHIGHYQAVIQAKRENDGVIVIVSGYTGDRGDVIGLNLQKRFRYTRELFSDDSEVFVAYLDESDIERYPNGWAPWLEAIEDVVLESTATNVPYHSRYTWYVGEEEYKSELEDRLSMWNSVKLLDRTILPISATLIRDNPLKYWNYITRPFRRHFSFNVLVMGPPSSGKTTLVRDLARSFGSVFSEEYARAYEVESNIRDEELVASDFQYLASGMYAENKKAIHSPANNGLFFADTNVTTTKTYSSIYLNKEEHSALVPMYEMLEAKEKWDLVIIVSPNIPYVDDGFRDMTHADEEFRQETLYKMMHDIVDTRHRFWGPETIIRDVMSDRSEDDPQGHYFKYKDARKMILDAIYKKYGIDLDARLVGE